MKKKKFFKKLEFKCLDCDDVFVGSESMKFCPYCSSEQITEYSEGE